MSRAAYAGEVRVNVGGQEASTDPIPALDPHYRHVFLNDPVFNAAQRFCNNVVITAKYSVASFLPKFLFESFQKVANVYFLVVIIFQSIPAISNTGGEPTLLPVLVFILLIDAVFAILEDIKRHQADALANSSPCQVYELASRSFVTKKWKEVMTGDIVMVKNRQIAPADVLILGVGTPEGSPPTDICYIETKSLDGETNLKMRQALESTEEIAAGEGRLHELRGRVMCEHPNRAIDKFSGTFQLQGESPEPVFVKNMLLRGCVLRNTSCVYGLVLNTGVDTKITRNASGTPSKKSSSDRFVNSQILQIVILLVCLCLFAAAASVYWEEQWAVDSWYMAMQLKPLEDFLLMFLRYFLLSYQFIPVSLYVTMAAVKYAQSYFIGRDVEMYHEETDTPALVRNMALNEDLGQVSYIFSDKTGTLTCNVMSYRKCSINGVSYGKGTTAIGRAAMRRKGVELPPDPEPPIAPRGTCKSKYVNFLGEDEIFDILEGKTAGAKSDQLEKIRMFFTHLAVCHTVIPEHIEGVSGVIYSASSPDEQALVTGAKYFGFEFVDRSPGSLVFKIRGEEKKVEVLDVLEFNSTRKRMSIIVRDETGAILLYCKGADAVIVPRLGQDAASDIIDSTLQHMEEFADDGLRTLAIAYKTLREEEYQAWSLKYHEALGSLEELEKRQRLEDNEIDRVMDKIEQNLILLGATAIEDRLQDDVPKTIHLLSQGGIKIWMLTGDKQETAVNIAFACQLFTDEMRRIYLTMEQCQSVDVLLAKLKEEVQYLTSDKNKSEEPLALVVDSEALDHLLAPSHALSLFHLARECAAVVACRVSPSQKGQLVTLVRSNSRGITTLAIGDGANDVGMIQKAHVGIGMSGMEGMQAVMASDFAIAQFKFLAKLLLVHGRWNYLRMSRLVPYMFYKCIMLEMTQYWYSWFQGFSGQKFYLEMGLQAFNVLYTALPIFLHGVLEQDVSAAFSLRHPQLYKAGPQKRLLNAAKFWMWLSAGIYQSLIITVVVVLSFARHGPDGSDTHLWVLGAVALTCVVLVSNLKLALCQQSWNWFNHMALWGSIFSFFFSAVYFNRNEMIAGASWLGIYEELLEDKIFWCCLGLVLFLTIGVDFARRGWKLMIRPHFNDIAREAEILGLPEEDLGAYLTAEAPSTASSSLAAVSPIASSLAAVPDGKVAIVVDKNVGSVDSPMAPGAGDDKAKKKKKKKKFISLASPLAVGSKFRRTGFAFSNDQDTTEAESAMVQNSFSARKLRKLFKSQVSANTHAQQRKESTLNASAESAITDGLGPTKSLETL